MSEGRWHNKLKNKIAEEGNGITEFMTAEGTRIDVKLSDRSIEIEKNPTLRSICTAIDRLETQPKDKKEIVVQEEHLDKTKDMATNCGVSNNIIIKNSDRTKRRLVKGFPKRTRTKRKRT